MKAGFTGTREGMTEAQWSGVWAVLHQMQVTELHHGDCVGADAQAHQLAQHMGIRIIIHPPLDEKYRAYCRGAEEIRAPKYYFERNRDIVDETSILIGTPLTEHQEESGGTWYTITYCSKKRQSPIVVWPSGRIEQGCWLPRT